MGWGALKSLDLALLVCRENERMVGGIEMESDDVSHLFDEERIGRKFEVPRSVWFYTREQEVLLGSDHASTRR